MEGGDRVYNEQDKRRVLSMYDALSKKYGIKFYNADNLVDSSYGCGSQCCGTEVLRNYKIWGGCSRSIAFGDNGDICSDELGKCLVNFTRKAKSGKNNAKTFKTIEECSLEYMEMERKRIKALEEQKRHKQLSLFDDNGFI